MGVEFQAALVQQTGDMLDELVRDVGHEGYGANRASPSAGVFAGISMPMTGGRLVAALRPAQLIYQHRVKEAHWLG